MKCPLRNVAVTLALSVIACVSQAQTAQLAAQSEIAAIPIEKLFSSSLDDTSPSRAERPPTSKEDKAGRPALPMGEYERPFSRVGVAAKVGSMGVGLEAATPLGVHLELRLTGNFFAYTDNASRDSFRYAARLRLRSLQTSVDWYPLHNGFRISPGIYFFGGNQVSGHANVAPGANFTLNGTEYISSPTDPIKGSGAATVNNFGPQLTVGWGNLLPRGKHFSFPFEIGGAYQGKPKVLLHLTGSACNGFGQNCQSVATLPDFEQNLTTQLLTINHDAEPYKYYPILSIGVAYKF